MQNLKRLMLAAAIAAMTGVIAKGEDLSVTSEGMTISASPAVTYANVNVNGNLTVTGKSVALKNSGTITIGESASSAVTVKVENGAVWQPTADGTLLYFKGKCGTIELSAPSEVVTKSWSGLGLLGRYTQCYLTSDAAPDSEIVDLFHLKNNGMLAAVTICNQNASTVARVVFDGGYVFNCNGTKSCSYRRFDAETGCELRLEGVNGNPVHYEAFANSGTVFGGGGTVVVTGACDAVINAVNDWNKAPDAYLGSCVLWRQTGDLRLGVRGTLHMSSTDTLPYGANTGIVRLEGSNVNNPFTFDLAGKYQRLNGMVANGNSILSNSSSVAYLQFGDENTSGSFNVPVLDSHLIGIRKVGTGTLTITNTPGNFAYLAVDAGTTEIRRSSASQFAVGAVTNAAGATLAVYADTSVNSLVAAAGSSIVVDGCTLSVNTTAIDPDCTIEYRNGGSLVRPYACDSSTVIDGADATNAWKFSEVVKTGAGTLSVGSDSAMPSRRLHVVGGTLAFGALGITNSFWKFVAKGSKNGVRIGVGPVRLYDKDKALCDGGGNNTSAPSGWSAVDASTDPSALEAKQILCKPNKDKYPDNSWVPADAKMWYNGAWTAWRLNAKDETPPYGLTSLLGNTANGGCCFTNTPFVKLDDSDTWLNFIYRIPSPANCVRGYDLRSVWSGNYLVNSWEMWTSPNGSDWTLVDARTNVTIYGQRWYSSGEGGDSSTLSTNPYKVMVMRPDAVGAGFDAATPVEVDSGATLDCSLVADGQEISSLTVDCSAGGGTLKGVKFAATGTLELTNFSAAKLSGYEVPLSFVGVADTANLANWTVKINGSEASGRHLAWNGEKLVVSRLGSVILMW